MANKDTSYNLEICRRKKLGGLRDRHAVCAGQDGKSKHEIRSKCEELGSAQARTVGRAEYTSGMSRVPGQVQMHTLLQLVALRQRESGHTGPSPVSLLLVIRPLSLHRLIF